MSRRPEGPAFDREAIAATVDVVRSVIDVLNEALQNAPEFREILTTETLDVDPVPLVDSPVLSSDGDRCLPGGGRDA